MPIEPARYNVPYSQELQTAWANVLAFAWQNPDFLNLLRENPATAIVTGAEQINEIQAHCSYILEQNEGVLGIPNPPPGVEHLSREDLVRMFDIDGLFGIIRGT